MTGTRKPGGVKARAEGAATAASANAVVDNAAFDDLQVKYLASQQDLFDAREALTAVTSEAEVAAVEGRARIAELEQRLADDCPTATHEDVALETIRDRFIEHFPDDWEALRLCPLQHGIDAMIERFKV